MHRYNDMKNNINIISTMVTQMACSIGKMEELPELEEFFRTV
jgi:hypothetical protein